VGGTVYVGGLYWVGTKVFHNDRKDEDAEQFVGYGDDDDKARRELSSADYLIYRWLRRKPELGGMGMAPDAAREGTAKITKKGSAAKRLFLETMRLYSNSLPPAKGNKGAEVERVAEFAGAADPYIPTAILREFIVLHRKDPDFAHAMSNTAVQNLVKNMVRTKDLGRGWERYTTVYERLTKAGFPKDTAALLAVEANGPNDDRLYSLSFRPVAMEGLKLEAGELKATIDLRGYTGSHDSWQKIQAFYAASAVAHSLKAKASDRPEGYSNEFLRRGWDFSGDTAADKTPPREPFVAAFKAIQHLPSMDTIPQLVATAEKIARHADSAKFLKRFLEADRALTPLKLSSSEHDRARALLAEHADIKQTFTRFQHALKVNELPVAKGGHGMPRDAAFDAACRDTLVINGASGP
jgi:hypothetical protein